MTKNIQKEYAKSEKTRKRIIDATGKLIATRGIDALSTRAIALHAYENIGTIHYQFGKKENLLRAVVDTIIEPWKENPLEDVIAPYMSEIGTSMGTQKAMFAIVNRLIEILTPDHVKWHGKVIYQLLQHRGPFHDYLVDELITPANKVLKTVFQKVNPQMSEQEIFFIIDMMRSPIISHALFVDSILERLGEKTYPQWYLDKLENSIVHTVLSLLAVNTSKNA